MDANYIYIFNLIAMFVFGLTGVLAMKPKNTDLINVIFLGTVTAIGGGTTRDFILNQPAFWVIDPNQLIVPAIASITIFYFYPRVSKIGHLLEYLDGMGLALFVSSTTSAVLANGYKPIIAVAMGVITGVFGGIIRDVLLNRKPIVMGATFYITPAIIGATFYVIIHAFMPNGYATLLAFSLILLLRFGAIRRNWMLPSFFFFEKRKSYED